MTYRNRIAVLITATALVVAACSSDDTSGASDTRTATNTTVDDAATSTTTVPTTTSSTSSTTTTTTLSTSLTTTTITTTSSTSSTTTTEPVESSTTERPATTVSGEPDWFEIVTDLRAIMDEISANPDPSRIPEVAVVGGEWDTVTGSGIRNTFERGERIIGLEPTDVVSAELADIVGDVPLEEATSVLVNVTIEARDLSNAQLVDSNGEVVFDLVNDSEPGDLSTSTWVLNRTDDGWRVAAILT